MPTPYSVEDCWCNHMRTCRCQYRLRGAECKFCHVDEYSRLTPTERKKKTMRGIMDKHGKVLKVQYLNDLQRCIAEGETWQSIATSIRSTGWDGYVSEDGEVDSTEDSEGFVVAIVKLVVHTLHYDVIGAADVMFRTVTVLEDIFQRCLQDSSSQTSSNQSVPPSPEIVPRYSSTSVTPLEMSISVGDNYSYGHSTCCTPDNKILFDGRASPVATPNSFYNLNPVWGTGISLFYDDIDLEDMEVFLLANSL